MHFWPPPILSLLSLLAAVGLFAALWRLVPALSASGLPSAVPAGLTLLALGPTGAGLLDFDPTTYELLVYHGLAVVFIAYTLLPDEGVRTTDTVITALAVPAITVLQGMVGLLLVLLVSAAGPAVHPGYGQALPMAFSQGPGQAIAMGTSWEALGMKDGGQIALTMAALGYVWCFAVGLPLLSVARRWMPAPAASTPPPTAPASTDGLAAQLGLVALIYLFAWFAADALHDLATHHQPKVAALVWGFHFLLALLAALLTRAGLGLLGARDLLDPTELRRIGGATVDVITAAAFAALQLTVVWEHAALIGLITTVGGLVTALACAALARWAYREDPVGHGLAMFGTLTGTLPTGLALLRAHDPSLRSPAAQGMVLGTAGAMVPGVPVLLLLVPMPIVGWPESFPAAVWQTLGLEAAYFAGLLVLGLLWLRRSAD